ncbi:mediator complex subunit Med5-domain-containing protein [Lentinula aff. lateritia]|uniref:Mediator complex subunit Med5-domain-containing protein n=1 Tax=Lentinula aff. lateritia TaxID=2804960 RepID=A0ACC1UAE7_9AGAR|nr:mediator complex subunit Med5-domain-containing protein [Lentinula aff. lateritia]
MTIPELTRNCFQSGISAVKWAKLCKLFISRNSSDQSPEAIENSISNSVLVLYRSYPGDPALHEYLKYALNDGMISLAVFIATLLQAARNPELHNAATLDMLCRIALDAHYSSGQPNPIGSVVAFDESPIVVLGVVQDALLLLEIAHTLPVSHFHQLTTSSSELLIRKSFPFASHPDFDPPAHPVHYETANDLLLNFQLSPGLREVLEHFERQLRKLMGDDAKLAREAQMMHTMQLTLGRGDIVGSSSNNDLVSLSLTLHALINFRAGDFGAANLQYCAALLVGLFRWSSWSPTVFYTQLLLCAFVCLSQSSTVTTTTWKTFIVGRLPQLLVAFEKCINTENPSSESDWKHAMQNALFIVLRRNDVLSVCDSMIAQADGNSSPSSQPLARCFLKELLVHGLLEQRVAVTFDHGIVNDNTPSLRSEAQDAGMTLEIYLETKLSGEGDEPRTWLSRIRREPGSHIAFGDFVKQRFADATSQLDIEAMGHICKLLYHDQALDALSLHIKTSELVAYALQFFELYTCETVGDPQTALSHIGDVVMFLQSVLARFNFQSDTFSMDGKTTSSEFLKLTAEVYHYNSLTGGDLTTFNAWLKALFESEGIEDTILRSTQPKTLLRVAASLVLHAIGSTVEGKMNMDTLRNGVMYFTDPLLNWTLVGVIKALLQEIHRKRFNAPIHLEVLQTLLLSPSCPRLVLTLCGPRVMSLLVNRARKEPIASVTFNNDELQRVLTTALGAREEARIRSAITMGPRVSWQEYPRQAIQTALNMARTNKLPSIDVERCLKVVSPSKFLQVLWSELVVVANVPSEIEHSRRLAVFILTAPRPPTTPPLLPIFLHNIVPSLIIYIDSQPEQTMTMSAELLVALVSSVLTAVMHLELAMQSATVKVQPVFGQTSSAMARRLVSDLRTRKFSYTGNTLAQRLSSSQSFLANFPVFMELGT